MHHLLRRVHPDQVVQDKDTGVWRASSGAFRDPDLSCDNESIWASMGKSWEASLEDYPAHSLVRLPEVAAVAEGQEVVPDPLPNNPAHTLVKGKKTKPIANRLLAASSTVVIKPRS